MNDRRDFLRTLGRGVLLAGVAGVGGYLLLGDQDGAACTYDFICGSCRRKEACSLPEAKEYSRATAGKDKNGPQ